MKNHQLRVNPKLIYSSLSVLSILLLSSSGLATTRDFQSKDFTNLDPSLTPSPLPLSQDISQADTTQDPQRIAAQKLFNEGMELYKQGTAESLKQAIIKWKEALLLWQEIGDRSVEANILHNIGSVYDLLGEKEKALDFYNQSLPISQEVGDRKKEATTLNNIGAVYDSLGEKEKALDFYNQSLPISQEVGDLAFSEIRKAARSGEAATLHNIGRVYGSLGEKEKALDLYNQSLSISQEVGDRKKEATTLHNIGAVYDSLGEKEKALDFYNQSLPISQEVGDLAFSEIRKAARSGEAATLHNIGRVYGSLGEKEKALDLYNQSLSISQEVGDRKKEAATLDNIGRVYDSLGEKEKALDFYNQSLSIKREIGYRSGEATTLNNIGSVYDSLGEKEKALDFYNQSLPISQEVGDLAEGEIRKAARSGEANTLNNIGLVYDSLGEKEKALDFYNQSLPISQEVGDLAEGEIRKAARSVEANSLHNIGGVYDSLGEKEKALDFYNQSLPIRREIGGRSGEATTLNNIGAVYNSLGEKEKALDFYNQSLPISQEVGDRSQEALSLYNIAHTERDRGNLQEALTQMESSIEIIEDLRTKVASPELRTSYFATVQSYYQFYIDLLMQLHQQDPDKGYDGQALNASERSRARSLVQLLTESNTDIRQGVDPQLLQQENTLENQLDAIEKQRVELYSNKNATDEQKTTLEQDRIALLEQYQDIQNQIRSTSPQYATLKYPQPLTLQQIQQQVLDEDTLLLQYSLGEERSYLWAVTQDSITSHELASRQDIETAVNQFYTAITLTSRRPIRPSTANKLSQLILQPVANQLNKKRIVIVSDGALNYIPFAALPLPTTETNNKLVPLITNHEIVNLPSSSTLGILRRQNQQRTTAPKTVAIVADPVFSGDDCRFKETDDCEQETPARRIQEPETSDLTTLALNRSARNLDIGVWERLRGTRQEAQAIMELVPESQRMQAFDFEVNLATATNPQLSQYQIVHFATHGLLNSVNPELSGIVFSLFDQKENPQNGFLRLHDIFNLNLSAELVVLSACQTGLGKEVKGEGLVGLTRGFMYAGTPRVLVSLWSVDDAATAEFMTRFYRLMLEDKLSPAEALRATQLEMQQETQWKAPYYWAAFTLQGEWN